MSDPQQLREKIAKELLDFKLCDDYYCSGGCERCKIVALSFADALLPLVLGEKREAWDEAYALGKDAVIEANLNQPPAVNPYLPAGDHTENENEGGTNDPRE